MKTKMFELTAVSTEDGETYAWSVEAEDHEHAVQVWIEDHLEQSIQQDYDGINVFEIPALTGIACVHD